MNESNPQPVIHFRNLDILRFIAAFMIIIYHTYIIWSGAFGSPDFMLKAGTSDLSVFGKYFETFVKNLSTGVDVFFLISGFLITYILLQEKERYGKLNIKNFFLRRGLRIWPLYFFLIAIAPLLVSWIDVEKPHYLSNIFFYHNFYLIDTKAWMFPFAHFWSICIEEHFYLVWPFIIAFVPKKRLLSVLYLVIFSSIVYRAYLVISGGEVWFNCYLNTLSRIDVITVGAIGAYFYSKKPFVLHIPPVLRIISYISLIALFSIDTYVDWGGFFLAVFKKYIYIGLFCIAICNYMFNPDAKLSFKKKNILHYFGRISYGIYMYGNILLLILIKKLAMLNYITNFYVFVLVAFSLSILIPIISYELYEKHFLKLKDRFALIKTKR
ncbi:MAG: acyltransferase [Bacteroidota bacterium]